MLIVMTIYTEQLPVAAVRRVVFMVVILMMDREFTEFSACKFPAATGADPRVNPERALPVALLLERSVPPGFCNQFINVIILFLLLIRFYVPVLLSP